MRKQLVRIAPHQSSKVMAALYVVFTLPLVLIGLLTLIFGGDSDDSFPALFFILAPVIYGILGYIGFALFCWLYNMLAKRLGGIEFSVVEQPEA